MCCSSEHETAEGSVALAVREGAHVRTYSQVFISPAGDWTRKLSDNVKFWSTGGGWVAPCWVQGPFLSPFSAAVSHGRLMLVASGIGLSAALPLVLQMCTCEREVHLVWITRSLEQLVYQLPLLQQCTSCLVYFTGKELIGPEFRQALDALRHVALYKGRPKLDCILAWLVKERSNRVRNLLLTAGTADKAERTRRGSLRASVPRPSVAVRRPSLTRRASTRVEPANPLLGGDEDDEVEKLPLPETAKPIDGVDVSTIQDICRRGLTKDEAWCCLYCGAVPVIQKTLKTACTNSKFHYAEESFAW